MKKLLLNLMLVAAFNANAQTLSAVAPGNVISSAIGSSTSLRIGSFAGNATFTGPRNVFMGFRSGFGVTNGADNTFMGYYSGATNSTGLRNTFLGSYAGQVSNASDGTFIGFSAGSAVTNGSNNTFVGRNAGISCVTGQNNTYIGGNSGYLATGSNNVFIGRGAGWSETASNRLWIDVFEAAWNPLIWGDFAADQLKFHGKVGIGGNTTTAFGTFSGNTFPSVANGVNVSAYTLFVKGGILTEELRISTFSYWADYVFAKDYQLKPLLEVEKFIDGHGHLPNVPSAAEIKEQGFEVAEMSKMQQEKIEELTLYAIAQEKTINDFSKTASSQKQTIESLRAELAESQEKIDELAAKLQHLLTTPSK
jgi:hypothetical protein